MQGLIHQSAAVSVAAVYDVLQKASTRRRMSERCTLANVFFLCSIGKNDILI